MKKIFLNFEQPVAELEKKADELRELQDKSQIDISEELQAIESKIQILLKETYQQLSAWQVSQIARHPQRPYTLDYLQNLFTDFQELHGDRAFADDKAIVGGIARFENISVVVVGQQKGRDVKERLYRNFGMPRPEGYRKALRLYRLAEKFDLPIITFIDTPGAYPGIDAEERGQSEAIARNLYVMSELKTPIIGIVVGEGGSGGALALGVVDKMLMLQYATYSVISPEGCASILWKNADKAELAAESLRITSQKLKSLGLVDVVVPEPLGGAHRTPQEMFNILRPILLGELKKLRRISGEQLLKQRYQKLMSYGKVKEIKS